MKDSSEVDEMGSTPSPLHDTNTDLDGTLVDTSVSSIYDLVGDGLKQLPFVNQGLRAPLQKLRHFAVWSVDPSRDHSPSRSLKRQPDPDRSLA